MEFLLMLLFTVAVPVNIWVAVEIHHYAWPEPRISLLVLFSKLVTTLAILSVVLAVVSLNAVVFLVTGIRIIPTPIPTVILVGALLLASGANGLVWVYLRGQRRRDEG